MEAIAEASLVTAARAGDGAAYGELFSRYQSRIYNYAYGIAGNREDAADIAQEAFARVFQALPRLTGDLNFSAYVYRTTHNVAVDAVKGRSHFVAPEVLDLQVESSLRADPERVALVQEQQQQAWQAAFRLSDDHRAILTLRELHDLSYQEIADIMDMPRNTVGVLLSRARLRFKEAFRMSSIDIDKLTAECRDMLPLLSAYLDDELDEKKRARVESHLEQCAFCRLALEEMAESSRSYRALLPLLPPAALGEGLWHRLGDLVEPGRQTPAADGGPSVDGSAVGSENVRPPAAPTPKVGRRYLHPRPIAMVAGGVIIVVVAVVVATGMLGGRGGSDVDNTSAAKLTATSVIAHVSATPIMTASVPENTTVTTPVTGIHPSTSEDRSAVLTTVSPASVSTRSSTATSTLSTARTASSVTAPETGPEGGAPAPTTPTMTDTRDTVAPATPGIVYPANGEVVKGPSVTLRWRAVKDPSGVSYTVEVQSLDQKAGAYVTSRRVEGIKGPELAHVMVSTVERWRVLAVDGACNAGQPSAWAKFAQPQMNVTPTKPTTTTTTLAQPPLTGKTLPVITTTTSAGLY